ncbi:MAG: Smr/MutS family protein [Amaricoccus sp.]|uniref:Smr/MutS family protein n=1 Tax=Amaricoccus sp. TaxID=1872485 RepID=UPI0033151D36
MAGRRRRGLSPEERALWNQVAARTTPLRPPDAPVAAELDEVPAAGPPVPAIARSAAANRPVAPRLPEPPRVTCDLVPDPRILLERAHPHMDRRRFDSLRRGRMEPEARLDLHGMTSEHAHARLIGFIQSAHASGLRLVLVITGKGRADEDAIQPRRHGILRHSLPHWLAAPPLAGAVLQVASAHQKHGGGGAYYVYLRRRRGG